MTITQTPDLSSVETFFDGTYVHVLPECADGVPGATMIPTSGFGDGFPCSCADDLLTSSYGRGTGVAARLAGNIDAPHNWAVDPSDGEFAPRSAPAPHGPSERQVSFLTSLAARKTEDGEAFVAALRSGAWTSRVVSSAIDRLLALPDLAGSAPSAPARTNRYAAACRKCGGTVAAETGSLLKVASAWVVEHVECPAKAESAPVVVSDLPDVPQGHYAYPSSGSNDLSFVRVDRPTEGRWAGRTFVKQVIGGRPDAPIARANVASVLASIVEFGVDLAAQTYGQEIGRCYRCNRHLTDETSRSLGIGPDCRSRS